MGIFKSRELFGNRIDPACSYCKFAKPTQSGEMMLCPKKGVVAPYYHCNKYAYSPLRRVPTPQVKLQQFDKSDFEL